MQPSEVGTMQGSKNLKPELQAVAGSTRRGRGSSKEKGHTPMVMGSRPMATHGAEHGSAPMVGMATHGAEHGSAPMVGSLTAVLRGTIHGPSGKPAVAGKTRV